MSVKVAKKILEVMKRVDYLQKDGEVAYKTTRYNYLSEEKITSAVRVAMVEVGLVMYPVKMEIVGEKEAQTRGGTSRILNILNTYRIQDSDSGEFVDVPALGEGMDSGDKTSYKAMTGAFKYAQRQTFMIPTGDDPDRVSSNELVSGDGPTKVIGKKTRILTPKQQQAAKAVSQGQSRQTATKPKYAAGDEGVIPGQLKAIEDLTQRVGLDDSFVAKMVQDEFGEGVTVQTLTKQQAGRMIYLLQGMMAKTG